MLYYTTNIGSCQGLFLNLFYNFVNPMNKSKAADISAAAVLCSVCSGMFRSRSIVEDSHKLLAGDSFLFEKVA